MNKFLLLAALVGIGLGALILSRLYLTPNPTLDQGTAPAGYVKVEVRNVEVGHSGGVMYLGEKDSDTTLPIFIGEAQAQIIGRLLNNGTPERPLMHDLLREVLDQADMKLAYISVDRLDKGVYYATVVFENGKLIEIDARPSDSVILALRNGAQIYVKGELIEKEGVSQHPPVDIPWRSRTI